MPLDKVRIRFRKAGDLRMVSHLDLMRSFERMLRRAQLPFHMTGGFHPTPRVIFAQSLSLGIIGHHEVVEIELTETIEPAEIFARLQSQAPPGLEFRSVTRIPIKTTARPRRALYRLNHGGPASSAVVQAVLAAPEIWVERERPRPRQINIRHYIDTLTASPGAIDGWVWLTQDGTVRADELVRILALPSTTMLERLDLELHDEIAPEEAARTPKIEPQTRPWNTPNLPTPETSATPDEIWGATANGPVVE